VISEESHDCTGRVSWEGDDLPRRQGGLATLGRYTMSAGEAGRGIIFGRANPIMVQGRVLAASQEGPLEPTRRDHPHRRLVIVYPPAAPSPCGGLEVRSVSNDDGSLGPR